MSEERPILFSAPMVRAILEGRKTQTRRVAKLNAAGRVQRAGRQWHVGDAEAWRASPYGVHGERLWVRETFSIEHACDGNEPPHKDGRPIKLGDDEAPAWMQAHYKATDEAPDLTCESERCRVCESRDFGPHWKPCIHMPRWASRITLWITGIRVERLQEITTSDAEAEGWPGPDEQNTIARAYPIAWYAKLWDEINGSGAFDANPFVWVIEFTRVNRA